MKKLLSVLFVVGLLSGCAGTAFKWNDARKIEAQMSIDQVTSMLGKPTHIKASGDTLIYVWVWVNMMSETRTLRVDFTKDGKVIKAPPIPDSFQD